MKLLWSSRNQKFIGHSMTHDELASMSDVYSVLSPDYRKRQTTYVLQVLWRDLTSEFDIIGPHYTSDSQFPHQALCRLLIDSIHQFHVCGFETVAVVCDGAAPNMTMVKEMSGAARKAYRCAIICKHWIRDVIYIEFWIAYSLNTGSAAIDPSFVSPYTGRSVHFIICPSHQVSKYACVPILCLSPFSLSLSLFSLSFPPPPPPFPFTLILVYTEFDYS